MLGQKILGPVSNADTTQFAAEKEQRVFTAAANISVGMTVALTSGDTTGTKVVKTQALATQDHLVVGVYEGIGGTGADTTATGATGKDAVTNDIISVTTLGIASALIWAQTTTTIDNNILILSLTSGKDGYLEEGGQTLTAGVVPAFITKEAASATTSTVTTKKVWVNCI